MASLKDYSLEFFFQENVQKAYREVAIDKSLSVAEKIVKLLTLNPQFINGENNIEEEKYKEFKIDHSIKLIREAVEEQKKLEFFALYYNAKTHIKSITNGIIYPDASEILILLHLNTIFKYINEIYLPGATLRIGNQIHYFQKFNEVTEDEAIEMVKIIDDFNRFAEQCIGVKDKVVIYDVYEEVNKFKKEFYLKVEDTKLRILQEDKDMAEIRKGADYYLNYVVDNTRFPNKQAAWNFCLYHTLDSAAYKLAIMNMNDRGDGLFERFSEMIQVETRFQKGSNLKENENSVYISFLPGAETFSFNCLTAKMPNGKWQQMRYYELDYYDYKEVYVREYSYPLFYSIEGLKD